ncbi:SIS domain-containing protein [Dehalobacter sp. TeCB1]|uniref:D-sedoheptulose-7-phosphate isomerase n=1 Tax=Dehalobacter sp. TeCB1 TaxID=1843715 RepID=UPI00083AC3F6|nr:SIS domain-containing protein [Dehalobacter sp. TeCB1]OCZ49443.1 hypothetical protein A7D23_03025 [Dehalobacter sp. TeCB1]
MKNSTGEIIADLYHRYPLLKICPVAAAVEEILACYDRKNKLLICGNGGSAADSLHIVGELMKGFLLPRNLHEDKQMKIKALFPEQAGYFIDHLQEAIPVISLVNETALLTAYANDQAADLNFAQQVIGLGMPGDILIAVSTSGNSRNVVYAAQMAKVQEMKVIALTGRSGGLLKALADVLLSVPADETYIIQEYHLPIYHTICLAVENELFGGVA